MKDDDKRFLHLNCGLETVTTSAEMAQALRARASNLPAALGIFLSSFPMVSKFSWVSQFLTPLGRVTLKADEDALAASSKVYDGLRELVSGSKTNNLTYVLNCYKDALLAATPRKKPVFIIGTSSLCFSFPKLFFVFSLFFLPPFFLIPYYYSIYWFCNADEVNKLKKWRKTPEEETNLECLLDVLKCICKEENKAHVILATSEAFMITWLEKSKLYCFVAVLFIFFTDVNVVLFICRGILC